MPDYKIEEEKAPQKKIETEVLDPKMDEAVYFQRQFCRIGAARIPANLSPKMKLAAMKSIQRRYGYQGIQDFVKKKKSQPAAPFERVALQALSPDLLFKEETSEPSVARSGFSGSAVEYPHKSAVEDSLGVSLEGVKAHIGPRATTACKRLSAEAYTFQQEVAFRTPNPSFGTAIHEAVHIAQQSGIQLSNLAESGTSPELLEKEAYTIEAAIHTGGKIPPNNAIQMKRGGTEVLKEESSGINSEPDIPGKAKEAYIVLSLDQLKAELNLPYLTQHPTFKAWIEWRILQLEYGSSQDSCQVAETPDLGGGICSQEEPQYGPEAPPQSAPLVVPGATPLRNPPMWKNHLINFVNYEDTNGTMATLVKYHPFNNDLLIPLNADIPSIYGPVDVDWMLRVTFAQMSYIPASPLGRWVAEVTSEVSTYGTYFTAKFLWNLLRATSDEYKLEFRSLFQEANLNAPAVVIKWIQNGEKLRSIFRPALEMVNAA